MAAVGSIIYFALWVAVLLLIARFVLDWVQMLARQWRPRGAVAVLCEGIYSVTDPPLRAVRGVIPPMRLGSVMLDLSHQCRREMPDDLRSPVAGVNRDGVPLSFRVPRTTPNP